MSPPETVDASPLETVISRLVTASRHLRNCAAHFDAAESARADAERVLREEAVESLCPVCGASLDADRLLMGVSVGQGGHEHGS
jgi:hypothetical protein